MAKEEMASKETQKLIKRALAIHPFCHRYVSPVIREGILKRREEILCSGDPGALKDYIERATDEECLCFLSEASLCAPLNSEAFRVYMYLAVGTFNKFGVTIPEEILESGKGELGTYHSQFLDRIRTDIRRAQLAKRK